MNSLRSTSIQLQLHNLRTYHSCNISRGARILARGVHLHANRHPGPGSLALSHSRRWASSNSESQPPKKSADMPWILISGVLTAGFVGYIMYSPKADKKAHDIVEQHVQQEKYVMPEEKDEGKDKDKEEGKEDGGSDEQSSESTKESKGSEDSEEKSKDKGKDKGKGKDDSSGEDKSEKKDTPNPQEGQDDIKESGKDDGKSKKERRGESFEKDNSNQANKGRGAGTGSGGGSTPREVESSEGKKGGGQRKDVK